jgi:arsenite methyltransferase
MTATDPVAAALSDPWGTLGALLDGPLHPGGAEATADLLDRAGVDAETTLLDVGCGAGDALVQARERGARAIGLDHDPGDDRSVRADLVALPVATGAADVALAECTLCLSADLDRTLADLSRVLPRGGRLAMSDVVVDGALPQVPDVLAEPLCLTGARRRTALIDRVEAAGFTVADRRDHRGDLLATRDRLRARVDYEGLLRALGPRGERLLAGIEALEAAVEDGTVGYVSLVARREGERAPRTGG